MTNHHHEDFVLTRSVLNKQLDDLGVIISTRVVQRAEFIFIVNVDLTSLVVSQLFQETLEGLGVTITSNLVKAQREFWCKIYQIYQSIFKFQEVCQTNCCIDDV